MTAAEADHLLANHPVALVRIDPRNPGRGSNSGGHWMRGKIIGVQSDSVAIVQPFGHRKTEKIELQYLKPWRGKLG